MAYAVATALGYCLEFFALFVLCMVFWGSSKATCHRNSRWLHVVLLGACISPRPPPSSTRTHITVASRLFFVQRCCGPDIREFRKVSTELSLRVGSDSSCTPLLLRCRCGGWVSPARSSTCEPFLGLGFCPLPPPSQGCFV